MKKDKRNIELGSFLRKKRESMTAEKCGMNTKLRRRTPGLRREEVAMLADVGITWYTWLEQGRVINASREVLERIANVLKLTDDEHAYLFALAKHYEVTKQDTVNNEIIIRMQRMIGQLKACPAYVIDREWNILCWNEACSELFGDFNKVQHRNVVWMMFFDDEYRKVFKNWEEDARGMLARYKKATVDYIDNIEWQQKIAMMSNQSEQFRVWWSEQNVNISKAIYKECNHPLKGEVRYELNCLQVQEDSSFTVVVHVPI